MSDQIDGVIDRWFEETASKINTEIKTDTAVDNLCSSIIPLAHNYCNAVLLLLNNDRRLPAMALLRVLAELALRVIWCLYKDNPNKEAEDVRIERWLKRSYIKRKSLLKQMIITTTIPEGDKEEFGKEIERLENMIGKIEKEPAGGLLSSTKELPPSYKADVYPLLYSTFNRAIHPDILLFSDLIRQDENRRVFLGDLNYVNIQSLKIYCMTAAFNIISVFRVYYNWDYKGMKSEYLDIKKRFKAS